MATYPITAFKSEILETIKTNPVTIITAETGAGKSTQVPQYLIEAGYQVIVTQPRRLAARVLAERVAKETNTPLGDRVGYKTAEDHCYSKNTTCLFVTDGLAMIMELLGKLTKKTVLVIDEVHEWNTNIEVSIAWAKHQLETGVALKLVVMSATFDAEGLSNYFNDAPTIDVPGRLFPIEVRAPGFSVFADTLQLVREGKNVLVFQPGKKEIFELIRDLEDTQVPMTVFPLHAELRKEEQNACFSHTRHPKVVVATTIAQTSLTIDDITAVVDTGLENRIEVVNGIEGLYQLPISEADSVQRKGRAGRTAPGVYIDHCPSTDRLNYAKAEILRRRLDQTVLRLAIAGIDATQLHFFHAIEEEKLQHAKKALRLLDCMDENDAVTSIGKAVSRIPIDVRFARMIVEARGLGVESAVIAIAALTESKGFSVRTQQDETPAWLPLCYEERSSDMLARLAVYRAAQNMDYSQFKRFGLIPGLFKKTQQLHERLLRQLGLPTEVRVPKDIDVSAVTQCIFVGLIEHLHRPNGYGSFLDAEKRYRSKDRESIVRPGDLVVGLPFDLQIKQRYGTKTLYLLQQITTVSVEQLAQFAPHRLRRVEHANMQYDATDDAVCSETQLWFDAFLIETTAMRESMRPEYEHLKAAYLKQVARQSAMAALSVFFWNLNVIKPLPVIKALGDVLYGRTEEAANVTADEILALVEWGREQSQIAQQPVRSSAPMSTKSLRPLRDVRHSVLNSTSTGSPVEKEKTAMELAFEKIQEKRSVAKATTSSPVPAVKKPTPAPLPEKRSADAIMEESLRALQAKYQK